MAKAAQKYKGLSVTKKTLADGTVKEYTYDRNRSKGDRKLAGKVGSHEFKASYRRGTSVTLNEIMDHYRLKSKRWKALAQSSRDLYERGMNDLRDMVGEMPMADLERQHVLDAIEEIDAPSRVNNFITVGSFLCNYAIERGVIKFNAFAKIEKEALGEFPRWPEASVDAIIDAMPERLKTPCLLAKNLGQRWSDVRKIKWSDYDEKAGTIKVLQKKTAKSVNFHTLVIPVLPELRDHLATLPRDYEWICVYRGGLTAGDKKRSELMERYQGQWPHEPTWRPFSNLLREYLDKLPGMDDYTFHGLRKTAAHRLAEAGCTAHEIMSITGHRTLSEVEKYTKSADQPKNALAAMSKMAASGHGVAEDSDQPTMAELMAQIEVLKAQLAVQNQNGTQNA
jgi:integrase